MLALASAVISMLGPAAMPVILWVLRRIGMKEEEVARFQESIKIVQADRAQATRPADTEAENVRRLHDRIAGIEKPKPEEKKP